MHPARGQAGRQDRVGRLCRAFLELTWRSSSAAALECAHIRMRGLDAPASSSVLHMSLLACQTWPKPKQLVRLARHWHCYLTFGVHHAGQKHAKPLKW